MTDYQAYNRPVYQDPELAYNRRSTSPVGILVALGIIAAFAIMLFAYASGDSYVPPASNNVTPNNVAPIEQPVVPQPAPVNPAPAQPVQ